MGKPFGDSGNREISSIWVLVNIFGWLVGWLVVGGLGVLICMHACMHTYHSHFEVDNMIGGNG